MGIGKRLKEARENAGLTQEQLAKMVGVTGSAITNYEKGTSHPKEPVIYALMDALHIEPNFLFQDCVNTLTSHNILQKAEIDHIKKYRILDAYGKEAVDDILDVEHRRCTDLKAKRERARQQTEESREIGGESLVYVVSRYYNPMSAGTGQIAGQEAPEEQYLIKPPPRSTSYIAPVSGDSMEPTYEDGDLLFIHATPEIEVGQVGVFLMDGQQWVKELGDGVLISRNEEYPPIPMTEDIVCQGLVLGVCDDSYF